MIKFKTFHEKMEAMKHDLKQCPPNDQCEICRIRQPIFDAMDMARRELIIEIKMKRDMASDQIIKWKQKRGVKTSERLDDGYARYVAYDEVLKLIGEKK